MLIAESDANRLNTILEQLKTASREGESSKSVQLLADLREEITALEDARRFNAEEKLKILEKIRVIEELAGSQKKKSGREELVSLIIIAGISIIAALLISRIIGI